MFAALGRPRAIGRADRQCYEEAVVDYTHYDYLDLPPGASAARVEAAYQTIRQRLNGHSDPELVTLIDSAYRVLSDTASRQAYDQELQRIADDVDRELKALLDHEATRIPRRVQDVPAPLVAAMSAWAA
jgi:curved DNA-binding protein CbpA